MRTFNPPTDEQQFKKFSNSNAKYVTARPYIFSAEVGVNVNYVLEERRDLCLNQRLIIFLRFGQSTGDGALL